MLGTLGLSPLGRTRFVAGGALEPVAGMSLWLKADSLALSDGDPVSTWADESGNGYDATNTGTARPTFKTNILNGKPVIRFDGTNDCLNTSLTYGTSASIILVATPSAQSNSYVLGTDGGGGAPAIISGFSSKAFEYYNPSDRETIATSATGFHLVEVLKNSSTSLKGYFDGTEAFSITPAAALANALRIAASNVGDYFNGDIAELLIYPSALSDADRETVEAYLNDKYSIY